MGDLSNVEKHLHCHYRVVAPDKVLSMSQRELYVQINKWC